MLKRRHPSVAPGEAVPLRLESCPTEGPIRVRFLGPYRGALIHKPGPKKQLPCPGLDVCLSSVHRGKTQWRGYAPAEWWREGQYQDWCPCVFEITERLGEILHGAELRGTIWLIERRPTEFGGREVFGVMIGEVDPAKLRPIFNVLPTLVRIFGTVDIALDLPSHKPPRLILTPTAGDPPPDLVQGAKAASVGELTLRDRLKGQLAAGTLPQSARTSYGPIIKALEAELASEKS